MADIVRISDGGQICIVESELEAALEVVGNLVVTGACTCGGTSTCTVSAGAEYEWRADGIE